jgi:hypothetical protein
LEIREEHEQAGLDLPPFALGDLNQWQWSRSVPTRFTSAEPLAGLDMNIGAATDNNGGLGLPSLAIVPTPTLLAALRTTSTNGAFELRDSDGPLIALRTWRALYQTSDYHQPWPRLTGTALVSTRRGFDQIAAEVSRLVFRDFVCKNDTS